MYTNVGYRATINRVAEYACHFSKRDYFSLSPSHSPCPSLSTIIVHRLHLNHFPFWDVRAMTNSTRARTHIHTTKMGLFNSLGCVTEVLCSVVAVRKREREDGAIHRANSWCSAFPCKLNDLLSFYRHSPLFCSPSLPFSDDSMTKGEKRGYKGKRGSECIEQHSNPNQPL